MRCERPVVKSSFVLYMKRDCCAERGSIVGNLSELNEAATQTLLPKTPTHAVAGSVGLPLIRLIRLMDRDS